MDLKTMNSSSLNQTMKLIIRMVRMIALALTINDR